MEFKQKYATKAFVLRLSVSQLKVQIVCFKMLLQRRLRNSAPLVLKLSGLSWCLSAAFGAQKSIIVFRECEPLVLGTSPPLLWSGSSTVLVLDFRLSF